MLYLVMMNITKKWTGRRQDRGKSIRSCRFSLKKGYPGISNFPFGRANLANLTWYVKDLHYNTSKGRTPKKLALPKVTNNICYIHFSADKVIVLPKSSLYQAYRLLILIVKDSQSHTLFFLFPYSLFLFVT